MSSEMQGNSPPAVGATQPVHVILVNYNRPADTIECLESLLRSDCSDGLHVIVVDNRSQDNSIERIRDWAIGREQYAPPPDAPPEMRNLTINPVGKPLDFDVRSVADTKVVLPRVLVLANASNEGFAKANNRAMRLLLAANREGYVCLINNDMVVAPGTIDAMVRATQQGVRIGAMGAVMLEYQRPHRVQMMGGGRRSSLGKGKPYGAGLDRSSLRRDYELGYVSGGALLARLSVLREVGLFDEDFFLYAEDRDLGVRMIGAGYRLAYAKDAEVWHKGSVTMVAGSAFQDYQVVRAQLHFVRKHTPLLLPLALIYSLFRSLAPKVIRRQWKRGNAVLRAYTELLLLRRPSSE